MNENVMLKELLMQRLNYDPAQVEVLVEDLCALSSELQPLLERWLAGEEVHDSKSYHGYSLDELIEGNGMSFPAALLTLDWLIKEPEKALPIISSGIY